MKKIKKKNLCTVMLSAACAVLLGCSLNMLSSVNAKAATSGTLLSLDNIEVKDLLLTGYNTASGDKVFNATNLKELYSAISGKANATYTDVFNLVMGSDVSYGTTTTTASGAVTIPAYLSAYDLYTTKDPATNQPRNQNILVEFGGQQWTVTFVTRDVDDNVIATLWLADAYQENGEYVRSRYGWYSTTSNTASGTASATNYVSNMYSSSRIRVETLNGGSSDGKETKYASSDSTTATTSTLNATVSVAERLANPWAIFTLTNDALASDSNKANKSLTDYIVTSSQLKYTYYEDYNYQYSLNHTGSDGYMLNEAINKDITGKITNSINAYTIKSNSYANNALQGQWYNSTLAAVANTEYTEVGYNDWAYDYVWLPSLSETGSVAVGTYTGIPGIWGTTTTNDQTKQNSFMEGEGSPIAWNYSDQSKINSAEFIWLRSGWHDNTYLVNYLSSGGASYVALSNRVLAVRPALHLNLTKAESSSATPLTSPQGATVSSDYNGKEQSLDDAASDLSWYNSYVYTDPKAVKITYSPATVKNADTYTVTVELLDTTNYIWSDKATNAASTRTLKLVINKKKLSVDFKDDENGYPVAYFTDTSEICTGDTLPEISTKYYKKGANPNSAVDSPTGLGDWKALAVIDDASGNYTVDMEREFPVEKKQLSAPVRISEESTTYSGSEKQFEFTGYDSDLMDYTLSGTAGATFDGTYLTATNAGTYTIKFTIKNTDLYEWTDSTAATYTVKINAKSVNLTCSDLPETWEKGEEVTFNVTTVNVKDKELALTVKYTRSGITATLAGSAVVNNGDGTYTITLPKTLAKGSYTLNVATAEGANYSGSLAERSFTITAEGYDFDESDLVWTVNGKDYTIANLNDDGVLEIEYAGKEITVKVNELYLDELVLAEDDGYDGDTAATDVGEYSLTVHIVSGSDEYAFDETFTLNYKIVAKEISFDNVVWQYSYDGENWTNFSATSKPSYTGDQVSVRVSPDYLKGLGLEEGDYTINYNYTDAGTDQNDYKTTALVTITNKNFTTASGNSVDLDTFEWSITPKSLSYDWSGTQTIDVDGMAFEIPAVKFTDGNDYSKYYTYYFTIDGEDGEYSLEDLQEYIAENWTEQTPVRGNVIVRMNEGETEVNINEGTYPFSTGRPKTPITVNVTGSGSEYGKVQFGYTALRDGKDERERTEVTVSGENIEAQTFDGTSSALAAFVNGLNAGSYVITLTLTGNNGDSYALSQYSFAFEIEKCRVELPTVPEIIYNGDVQLLEKLLIGYNSNIMELGGITSQSQHGTYTATVSLKDTDNYIFVKITVTDGNVPVKLVLTDEETVETIGGESELSWTIEKFVITQDMWDMSGKKGASIKLPSEFNALLGDEKVLKITYDYYTEQNGEPLANPDFKGGTSFYVAATLSGSEADNFVFENGEITSEKTVYTVPQNAFSKFMNNTLDFVKNNLALIIGCAVGLLLLILLIIIIAVASKKKKKREAELKEEKKLEREERMMRMQMGGMPMGGQMPITAAGMIAQQQMPIQPQMPMQPQYQPQYAPATAPAPQPTAAPAGDSGALARIEAELAAIREEQKQKTEAELANARMLVEFERLRGDMKGLSGAPQTEQAKPVSGTAIPAEVVIALLEAVKNNNTAPANAASAAPAAQPQKAEESKAYPPDAVVTTTTTVDTTKSKPIARSRNESREERSEFTDVDGFYEKYE